MRELGPGKRFALWYEDDTYWHERVALAEVRPGVWIIVTPDGHRYSENIRCRRGTSGSVQAVHLVPGAELLDPTKGHFYKFRAALDAPELVEQIKLAEGEAFGVTRRRRPAPRPAGRDGADGQPLKPQHPLRRLNQVGVARA